MPTTPSETRSKRKRAAVAEKPKKRARSASEESGGSSDPNAEILLLEQGILESRKNYNNIVKLLTTAESYESDGLEPMLSAVALCRIFVRLLAQGSLITKKSLSEKDLVIVSWLKEQLSRYKHLLFALLKHEPLSTTALTLSMRLLKAEGEYSSDKGDYAFPKNFLQEIIKAMVVSEDPDLRGSFIEDYAEQFDDIRFFTFEALKQTIADLGQGEGEDRVFDQCYAILSALDGVPESADELEDFYVPKPTKKNHALCSITQHKKQGQEAWLSLMSLAQDKDKRKKILGVISTVIGPWFNKPELLADFLTDSYNTGGSMSLLALSGVFYLIQERNIDYPSFYPKLYSLLDADILHSKHRSRFIRLLDTFLSSSHLPAALVGSFIKRISRMALNAPPSAIVFVIPWIYNLLKRHPLCTFMIHREITSAETKKSAQDGGFKDPFDPDEADPMATGAIDSSLWELIQLQSHYHPNVATIAKIISEQFTKQSYNLEDFLDHSYASLLEAEMAKDVKKAPVVEFQIPKRIFLPNDPATGVPDSLLMRLWNFTDTAA